MANFCAKIPTRYFAQKPQRVLSEKIFSYYMKYYCNYCKKRPPQTSKNIAIINISVRFSAYKCVQSLYFRHCQSTVKFVSFLHNTKQICKF